MKMKLDIKVYEGSGAARSFHIDVVREIRMDAYIRPNESDRKVYLLMGAQNLSEQAQNALLKILEEPPSYVLFLLVCKDKSALLPTVLSRAMLLSACGEETEDEEVRRRAENIAQAVMAPDELPLLQAIAATGTDRDILRMLLNSLSGLYREVYRIKAGAVSQRPEAAALAENLTLSAALSLYETAGELLAALPHPYAGAARGAGHSPGPQGGDGPQSGNGRRADQACV